jgi:hypothetical protein
MPRHGQEWNMHIHGNQANPNPINPYADAAEKALAANRSSSTRKKLLKRAAEVENRPAPDEASIVSRWMEDSHYSQGTK